MSPRDDVAVDRESLARDAEHDALRLWLRLLTCTLLVERTIRSRLRTEFATTLPRFDVLAQLARAPEGLRMGELSRRMMVTRGNVTGIAAELEREGIIARQRSGEDGRAQLVRLTSRGRRAFAAMAKAHERWVVELLGALPAAERARLHALLGRLKRGLALPDDAAASQHAWREGR